AIRVCVRSHHLRGLLSAQATFESASRTRACSPAGIGTLDGTGGRRSFAGSLPGARSIFPPARFTQCGADLFICAMRPLLHDFSVRAEQRRRFLRAQVLLLEQYISDPILF